MVEEDRDTHDRMCRRSQSTSKRVGGSVSCELLSWPQTHGDVGQWVMFRGPGQAKGHDTCWPAGLPQLC